MQADGRAAGCHLSDQDTSPENARQTFRLLPRLALTAVVTLAVMTAYEAAKQLFSPSISIWESHAVTVVFTTMLAVCVAYVVGQRLSANSRAVIKLNRALQTESRQIILHSEMSGFLQSCRNAEETCQVVRQFALRMFPDASGSIWMISESRNTVEVAEYWGESLPERHIFAPDECWALRRGQSYVVESASDMLCHHLRPTDSFPWICIPLTAQGETFGVLHLESSPTNPLPDDMSLEPKRRLWMAMAEHVSLALANLRLREKLRNQSIRDPLTGLFNRRYMEESLERELRRAIRHQRRLAVIMMDLDHFKAFNDSFGHSAGDALLRSVGELLQAGMRKEDIPCRYGGEEFAIILSESSLEGACHRAEELRESLKQIRAANYTADGVTVSMGVASYPEHASAADALLRAADSALYAAKKAGRDRVISFSVSEPHAEELALPNATRQDDE